MAEGSGSTQKEVLKACKKGDTAAVERLIKADVALLETRDADGCTLLHCACWKGNAEMVSLLLKLGADIHATNQNNHFGNTALHAAAHGNHKPVAEVLLAHGADFHAVNHNGRTPLQETTIHNATAVARLLKERGAS